MPAALGPPGTIPAPRCRTIARSRQSHGNDLDADLTNRLMRLAALRLEGPERALLKDHLAKIVRLIDAMQAVVQPLRGDRVTEAIDRDAFQQVAPEVRDGLYLVPRVVE